MARPSLSVDLPEQEFHRWYWLKSELRAFCRRQGLAQVGAKSALVAAVAAYLGRRPAPARYLRRKAGAMPDRFTLHTRIGEGWRCTRELRGFFEAHCGPGFRYNEALRRFLASGVGRSLAEAVTVYLRSQRAGPRPIAAQFEFNRHMRSYRSAHPGATHAQVVAAWRAARAKPRD
jgi:hypothetical protein